MQDFAQWSLDTIRAEGGCFSWMEEYRFDWATKTLLALEQMLSAKTIVLITDEKRKWFENYILSNINSPQLERPFLPIVSIDDIYPYFNRVDSAEMMDALEDMISLSYKNEYFFWYIGRGDDRRSDIAKRKETSYFWIFDEEYLNAFNLKSYDKLLDVKLIQLYKLFNLSLNAAIFGEIELGV